MSDFIDLEDKMQPDLGSPTPTPGQPSQLPNPFSPVSPTAQHVQPVTVDMVQMQQMMTQVLETAQAASQAAQAAAMAAASKPQNPTTGFSDANKILNRPSDFGTSSRDHDLASWLEWSHSFKSWLFFAEQGYENDLKLVESNLDRAVDLTLASVDVIGRSQRLYAILASVLKSKPKTILRQIESRNGLEVWRQLVNTYAPKSKARSLALLNALMSVPTFTKDKTLREQMHGIERIAGEYERVTGRAVGDDVLLGTLVRCLPQAIRQHVQLQMSDTSTYDTVRDYVLSYKITATSWSPAKVHQALGVTAPPHVPDQQPVPMEIDAVQRKGYPKGGGKDKGKGPKGKGPDKGAKGAKGKGKDKGETKGSSNSRAQAIRTLLRTSCAITVARRVILPETVGAAKLCSLCNSSRLHLSLRPSSVLLPAA